MDSLTRLIRTRRFPYAALTTAVSSKYLAENLNSLADARVPDAWVAAIGKRRRRGIYNARGTFALFQQPNEDLLSARHAVASLIGQELLYKKEVLDLEGVVQVPAENYAKKYFCFRLSNGQCGGTVSMVDRAADRRREHFVRVRSHAEQAADRGRVVGRVPANVHGAAHHLAVLFVDSAPRVFAFIVCVKSSVDRHGAFGLPEERRDTECFTSFRGSMRYVDV